MLQFNREQQREIARIAKEFNLNLIVLFGSQIKRDTRVAGDVDIAVVPEKDLDISSYSLLLHRLGKIIGNYNVDLTILKHVSPLLLGQIAKNCQMLYEKRKGDFLTFRLLAMRKYVDALPIFRVRENYLRRKVRGYEKELSK